MARGRKRDIVAYSLYTLLGAAAVTWTVITGLTRLDLLGNAVQVRLEECHQEGGGRGGSSPVCSGPQVGNEARIVEVGYPGHPGEVMRAAQKPWGSYEPVETGFISWGTWVLMPFIPLAGTAVAGVATVKEISRVRRRLSGDERAPGVRSKHEDDEDGASGAVTPA